MRVVLKITVTVNHNRIHKKYPLSYHTVTVTEINVREGHGNGTQIENGKDPNTVPHICFFACTESIKEPSGRFRTFSSICGST